MQGKKDYQEKLFSNFQLSDRVPKTNFYRRLREVLNLHFLYKLTKDYYGDSGQKSIDPVVSLRLRSAQGLQALFGGLFRELNQRPQTYRALFYAT